MRLPLLALLLAACGGGNENGGADAGPDASLDNGGGGTLALAQCGYSVTTRPGLGVPVPVAAGSGKLGADARPRQVHLGLAADPAHSVVVLWRTFDDASMPTTVRYGKASVSEASQDGFTFWYVAGGARPRMHEVHLCGLAPDTEYSYQVGGAGVGGEAWSPTYTFRTAPDLAADPSASIKLAVLGDTRGGQDVWAATLAKAAAVGAPDLILFTGDAVTLGFSQAEWDPFFDGAEPVLARVPAIFAEGNHELNSEAYFAQLALPGNEEWYSLDYGAAHITVLNDTPYDTTALAGVERDFLGQDLTAHANAPWKLLLHHKGMWSSADNHGSDLEVRAAWGPLVDQHKVDLVLAGHDHDYERSKPLRGTEVVPEGQGTVFVVSGSAGAPPYESGTSYHTALSETTVNFVIVEVRKGKLDSRAYRGDGSPLDSFSLAR